MNKEIKEFHHTPSRYGDYVSKSFISRALENKREIIKKLGGTCVSLEVEIMEGAGSYYNDEDKLLKSLLDSCFYWEQYQPRGLSSNRTGYENLIRVFEACKNKVKSPKFSKQWSYFAKVMGLTLHKDKWLGFGCYNSEALLSKIGELLAKPKKLKRTLIISCHPMDMLSASDRTNGWRSCYESNDGEYYKGCISMALNPQTFIVYTINDRDEKVNRRYFYMEGDSIVGSSKAYPNKDNYEKIEGVLLEYLGLTRDNQEFNGKNWISSNYIDDDVYIDESNNYTLTGSPFDICGYTEILCPSCGSESSSERYGDCCERHEYYCCDCDYEVDEDDCYFDSDGNRYCYSCYREIYFYCESCDEDELIEDSIVTHDGTRVCRHCSRDYGRCETTNEYYHNDDLVECSDGTLYNTDAYGEYYIFCEGCEQYINIYSSPTFEDKNGDTICEECYKNMEDSDEN